MYIKINIKTHTHNVCMKNTKGSLPRISASYKSVQKFVLFFSCARGDATRGRFAGMIRRKVEIPSSWTRELESV